VESAACGYLVALCIVARFQHSEWNPPPATTALGALYRHVTGAAHPENYTYQPTNVIFALFPPLPERVRKQEKRARMAQRAREDFARWACSLGEPRMEQRTGDAVPIGTDARTT
jgi:methylenetetrahydrofolate--tRNA-(uracil-5-)-methyltransferase